MALHCCYGKWLNLKYLDAQTKICPNLSPQSFCLGVMIRKGTQGMHAVETEGIITICEDEKEPLLSNSSCYKSTRCLKQQ